MSAHSTPPLASTSRFFSHDMSQSGRSTPLSLSASADDTDGTGGTGTVNGGMDEDDLDEDEEAWDEVDIPQAGAETGQPGEGAVQGAAEGAAAALAAEGAAKGIEIVISRGGQAGANVKGKGKAKGETARERMIRQERHKAHVLSLLAMAMIRNRWLNDKELQARILSVVPQTLLNAFSLITPFRYPNPRDRSRLFDRALADLTAWWYASWTIDDDHDLRRRDVEEVDNELAGWKEEGERLRAVAKRKRDKWERQQAGDSKGKGKAREPPLDPSQIPLFPWAEQPLLTAPQRKRALDTSASTSKLPLHPYAAPGTGPPVLIRPYTPASLTWEVLRPPIPSSSSPSKGPLASLYMSAHNMRGSRDLSSQLFVALLRAIDVPARLVVSLQAVEWRSKAQSGGGSKAKGNRRGKQGAAATTRERGKGLKGKIRKKKAEDEEFDFEDDSDSEDLAPARPRPPPLKSKMKTSASTTSKKLAGSASTSAPSSRAASTEVLVLSSTASSASDSDGFIDGHGKLTYKVPKIKLRGSGGPKGKSGQRVAGWKKEAELARAPSPDAAELSNPPTQWAEAYTRYNKEWITVDPVRKRVRCKNIMEPVQRSAKGGGEGNVLAYVVALEEDGSVRDVTPRYTRAFTNVTLKLRVPTSSKARKENGGDDWFAGVIKPFKRSFELNRDREEEEELWHRQTNAPFPTSLGGFKNHPNYVLEQHLHRDEALLPSARSVGLFKGDTPVFRRSDVVTVKSQENWYRVGRAIKPAEIPMKFVKQRAVTINRRREEELAKMDGGTVDEQPLYAESQTEVYVPPPVRDGKVPKNNFGNIDLFTSSMLPEGAVHLPSKVAAKCAKELGIDFAEAITGFEFRQRRAIPVMAGIVVAAEHAETLQEAILALEQSTLERQLAKQQDRVLKRWKKLIQGLRIRQRLLDQFKYPDDVTDAVLARELSGRKDQKGNGKAAKAEPEASATEPGGDGVTASAATPALSLKVRLDGSTSSNASPAIANSSHKRHSRSSPSPTSLSSSDESAPPPRKRLASSATASVGTGTLSGTSTSGRTLRVRLPEKEEVEEEASDDDGRRRSTRASARKAKGKLVVKDEDEDVEELTGQNGGADEPAEEASDDDFEFDEDF
ncbi:DNA repair protein Rad4 [Rhodotorula toruloides]|uniref:DNA repair protein Rad4 n=1 Tax=Rhodotorula toruloides TaxID=5286 RepID=A0A511KLI8_RHOTO|nr:DNA repair protein Rad4 [Rhodotorula toruloides]